MVDLPKCKQYSLISLFLFHHMLLKSLWNKGWNLKKRLILYLPFVCWKAEILRFSKLTMFCQKYYRLNTARVKRKSPLFKISPFNWSIINLVPFHILYTVEEKPINSLHQQAGWRGELIGFSFTVYE